MTGKEAAAEKYLVDNGWKPVEVEPKAVNGIDHHHPANGVLGAAVTVSFEWGRSSDNRDCPRPLAGRGVAPHNGDGRAYRESLTGSL